MYATLTAAALAFAAAQPPATAQPDRPGARPSIDGTWTIVSLEKNGQPVADAKNMTVSIRGNMITFNKAGTTEAAPDMKAMRVEFAQNGVVRVSETDDNKFSATAPATPPGTTPGSTGTGAQPATKSGVYVLTQDYLAVCVHDTAPRAGTAATAQPGEVRPASATEAQPAAGTGPQQRSYCTVILRRTEGGRPAASE
jgi:hypothetical protein